MRAIQSDDIWAAFRGLSMMTPKEKQLMAERFVNYLRFLEMKLSNEELRELVSRYENSLDFAGLTIAEAARQALTIKKQFGR